MPLKLSNTLSGKKELFAPLNPPNVLTYVCGITPYDYAHIGHGRVVVTFDLLFRFLKNQAYQVTYCRNFTDIDDKLIKKAIEQYKDPQKYSAVANKFIDIFHKEVKALNCLKPTSEPRVTENIEAIIQFINDLITAGKAYVSNGDVYFSVKTFPQYGKLSKQKLDELCVGARVEKSEKKQDPLDFALWKSEKENTFFNSPWGYGRPGWHIECSALALKFLGKQIDIHGGGADLIFPHHENEIAQTESLFKIPFAKYWLHVAFVKINQEKMSKSLGNVFNLHDIFKQFDPMVLRYYYLSHHYRSPLDFSLHDLEVAQKTYQKLCHYFSRHNCTKILEKKALLMPIIQQLIEALNDDLNSAALIGIVFSKLDSLLEEEQCAVKLFLQEVLGLTLIPLSEKEALITPEIEKLLKEREDARKMRDFKKADKLREQLKQLGYEVKDEKI
jgi:cysteinyl-tRNA synthetase